MIIVVYQRFGVSKSLLQQVVSLVSCASFRVGANIVPSAAGETRREGKEGGWW